MISISEAVERIIPYFPPLAAERVALHDALGRFVAEPLAAREDVPPFDNSAMDGYAVRAADVSGASREHAITLTLEGESRAGGPPPGALRQGAAMRIFTGAPLPAGADAVVIQEDAEPADRAVRLLAASEVGKHVRRRAEVLAVGQPFLHARAHVAPGEIGLLASQGYAHVPVHRRPRVAVLSSGDELRELGEPPRAGSLIDSNAHALAAAVREAGAEPVLLPLGADDPVELTERIADALRTCDVLVSTGGVSVGEYDFLHEAFRQAGVEELFWKIRVKPGKPVRFGVAGEVPVLGLPGNPVSALVTFELFVRPGLRRMLGDPLPYRPVVDVQMGYDAEAPDTRTELARVRLEPPEGGGSPRAVRHRAQGSAVSTSTAGHHALLILPEGAGAMPRGAPARALDLRGGAGQARSPWTG